MDEAHDHISNSHTRRLSSLPSLKHCQHDIEETDLFSIMSSREGSGPQSSVFSKQPSKQQQQHHCTSSCSTPDVYDLPTRSHVELQPLDELLSHMDCSSEDYSRALPMRPEQLSGPLKTSGPFQPTSSAFEHDTSPTSYQDIDERDDSNKSDDSDVDLKLEADADRALSEWYGIRLRDLPRPFRMVHLFEDVKDRCAEMLEADGLELYLDPHTPPVEEDDEELAQDKAGGPSHSTPTRGIVTGPQQQAFMPSKRKMDDLDKDNDALESSLGVGNMVPRKPRGAHRQRRNPRELSCPFRKRNPLRFNVSNYESCANRSYKDMTELK